jgi:transglutaminase-like putative cysteine protease
MKNLSYPPLYAGVFGLQALTAIAAAFAHMAPPDVFPFSSIWIALFGSALLCGYLLSRRAYVPGLPVQAVQIVAVLLLTAFWVSSTDTTAIFIVGGLSLLLARDALLMKRRELYFDLTIVLALFYDAVAGGTLPYRWPIAVAFLMLLIFVLIADYIDRRLAYAQVGDSRELTAIWPGLRKAMGSTVLVATLTALIYLLMPQPQRLGYGWFPDRGPPLTRFNIQAQNGNADSKGAGASGNNGGNGTGRDGDSDKAGGNGPSKTGGALDQSGRNGGKEHDAKGNDGRSQDGGAPGTQGRSGRGEGNGQDQAPGDRSSTGTDDGNNQGSGSDSIGNSDKGTSRQGQRPNGGSQQQSGDGNEKGGSGSAQGIPGGKNGSKGTSKSEGQRLGGQTPIPNNIPCEGPRTLNLAGNDPRDNQEQTAGKSEKSDRNKPANDKSDRPENQPSTANAGKGGSPPDERVVFFMDADRPLYLRTHAYMWPTADGWMDGWNALGSVIGRRMANGDFLFHGDGSSEGVRQRYKIVQELGERIPSAYLPTQLGYLGSSIGYSVDRVMLATKNVAAGKQYHVLSILRYIGDRPGGTAESAPSDHYLALPPGLSARVVALSREVKGRHLEALPTAEALEAYLRANYRRDEFNARAGHGDPVGQFLFEQRGGESIQFAGALAVMLRAVGIPSRIAGGYRARRLNPLHGNYEIWLTDRHYWVEAYIEVGWVTFEPSPWATLPAKQKPATAFEAAREYVRLAKEDDGKFAGSGGGRTPAEPPPAVAPEYLMLVLAYGWLVTFGPWVALGLLALGVIAWHWRWWSRPLWDVLDRFRLRRARRGEPAQLVRFGYDTVERLCARRRLERRRTENHAEYLERLASLHPHLQTPCRMLAAQYASARYGVSGRPVDAEQALRASRTIVELIGEQTTMPSTSAVRKPRTA